METFDSFDEFDEVVAKPKKSRRRSAKTNEEVISTPVEITEEIPEDVKAFLEGETKEAPEGNKRNNRRRS